MKITLSKAPLSSVATDLLAVGVPARGLEKEVDEAVAALDKAMQGALLDHAKDEGFTGKRGEVLKVPGRGRLKAGWVVLVGLGSEPPTPRSALHVAVAAARCARRQKSLAVLPPVNGPEAVRAVAEGLVTGAYRYSTYLTGDRRPKGGLKSAVVLTAAKPGPAVTAAIEAGTVIGEAVNLARDLVNAPPNDMNPPALANAAAEAAKAHGIECKVWDKKAIEKLGLTLLLAVSAGSGIEPRFVHMAYRPKKATAKKRVVFVGKGLTFDSGGLCLKPPKSMLDMKCDMAGAATTIGTLVAAARLELPIEVHGVLGCTENMGGDFAYRPGDVFKSYDGKTVEIINTDAEGRLVLADALAWARDELKPDYMIDHATLTGACMVALGPWTAGLFANDDELARLYAGAADGTAESFWRMPLTEDLREGLKSAIADLKHTGNTHGGAISAALFLSEFVGKTRWAHLDIAGPAHTERAHGILPKGGTGFGIATAVRFLEGLSSG